MSLFTGTQQQLRRHTGAPGAPATLLSGQLFVNDVDGCVYVGVGDNGTGVSTSQIAIGVRLAHGALAIATTNTLPALPKPMVATGFCLLIVDGRMYSTDDATPLFTVSGTAITWNAGAAGGFPLLPNTPVTFILTY